MANLFQMALGITDPWMVESVVFDPAKKRLDIRINFPWCDVHRRLMKKLGDI